jgi:Phage minor capsid protein 2
MSLETTYQQLEAELMKNIADYLASGKSKLEDDTNIWYMEKLNDLGALNESNRKLIAKYADKTLEEVNKLVEQEGFKALNKQEQEMANAALEGKLIKAMPLAQDAVLYATLATLQAEARDTINIVNSNILENANPYVMDIINKTTTEIVAGISTPVQALTKNATEFARLGVPAYVNYESGRRYSIESYTNMVIRSTSNKATTSMQMSRAKSYGVDLMEVSSHAGARPLCAPYQGRIYSMSGIDERYDAFSTTSYGMPAGLFGINCRHTMYPYWDGKSTQTFNPVDTAENDRIYKESQQQRALERKIREAKRERDFLMNANLPYEKAEEKVKRAQAKMREFIEETERTRDYGREKIMSN